MAVFANGKVSNVSSLSDTTGYKIQLFVYVSPYKHIILYEHVGTCGTVYGFSHHILLNFVEVEICKNSMNQVV